MEIEKIGKLHYEIHSFSSFSSSYLPENIRDNCPTNQISRWSSDTNVPTQFITLRLNKPAIVKKIIFGKYEKSHVCNLKKFKIYGGLSESNMFQIFEGGLKNDNVPEAFDLKHTMYTEDEGVERDVPVLFLQIVPLLSFGPSFNFSIWYVELQGIERSEYVSDMMRNFNEQREKQAIRLILKHLRDKGYMKAFKALETEAKISLEDNQITELFHSLVEKGDFQKTEDIMRNFVQNSEYIEEYIAKYPHKAKFSKISTDKNCAMPCARIDAGYAFDEASQIVFMHGGHCEESSEDLNDFWQYDLRANRWTLIHEHCSPITARSGHKMIFDPVARNIFFIGRRVLRGRGDDENEKNDFFLYDIQSKSFFLICEDVRTMNGPPLVYDHQIALNSKDRIIYVFGGRTTCKSDEMSETLSGFYSYHIPTNTWILICVDVNHPNAANPEINSVKARASHSMIYDEIRRKIYIIGGQRSSKEACNDIMQFDIDSNAFSTLTQTSNSSHVASPSSLSSSLPPSTSASAVQQQQQQASSPSDSINFEKLSGPCFAAMNMSGNEVYILMKDNLWMYALATNEFSAIHRNNLHASQVPNYGVSAAKDLSPPVDEACAQSETNFLTYSNGLLYVFKADSTEYIIELQKPSNESVLNYCRYLIRRQQYVELTRTNPINALAFLRNNLSATIDKNDTNQVNDFHKLASLLFCNKFSLNSLNNNNGSGTGGGGGGNNNFSGDINDNGGREHEQQHRQEDGTSEQQSKLRNQRSILFNKLTSILPKGRCQPQDNILNFINV